MRLPLGASIEDWDWSVILEEMTAVVNLNVSLYRERVEWQQPQQPVIIRAEIFEDGIIPLERIIKPQNQPLIDSSVATKEILTLDSFAKLSLIVELPHLWCPEDPFLYTVVLSLLHPDGRVLQCESARLGLRHVNINDKGQVCVNSKPIMVNGANLHAHHER